MAKTTKEERTKFVNKMKLELSIQNFGLLPETRFMDFNLSRCNEVRALKELIVRLNVFVERGKDDNGVIDFPEGERTIYYNLNGNDIRKCFINLKLWNKKKRYILDRKS